MSCILLVASASTGKENKIWELNNLHVPSPLPYSLPRQALTEVSVLSDVLQIAHNHKQYITMDPVVAQPSVSVSPAYQYLVKKKVKT